MENFTAKMFIQSTQIVFVIVLTFANGKNVLSLDLPQYTSGAYHHKHILGSAGNYTLEWKVNWETKSIVFNVSAECKGYVGLGLSKTGSIANSDFVIGGIDSSGKSYFSDMHGIENGTLKEDYRHDWKFLYAHRGDGRIHLSFSRPFETCDDEDYPISGDLVHVIWAYGDTDEITLFSPYHGNQSFYLLDPNPTTETATNIYREIGPHSNLYLMQRWAPLTRQKLPVKDHSQMCSIIKGPQLSLKHYILGGGAYLPFEESREYVRQIILTRCMPPPGKDAAHAFDHLIKREGQECNDSFQNSSLIPKHLCTEIIFVWGIGGKPYYFPDEMGIPIGHTPNEYYLMEVHYINPKRLQDVTVKTGLELMIHPRPRMWEGGVQMVNYGLYGLFTIPPRSASFSVYGHCSSQCTKDSVPKDGMQIVAVLFQMRGLGKSIRLRHFRGAEELPWILHDDNYEGKLQQMRSLSKIVTILPGDHLTVQCTYDTSSIANTTFSGFALNQESCVAYLVVNQRVSSAWCSSEYSVDNQLQYLGNQNSSRSLTDKNARWSPSTRAALQREMLHGLQLSSCPSHIQLAKSARTRKLPIIPNRNRKRSNETGVATTSFGTPFATNVVAIPNISLEYRPTSDCQRNNAAPANNFGYHRNVLTSKFKSQTSPITTSTTSPVQEKITTRRFRRVNG